MVNSVSALSPQQMPVVRQLNVRAMVPQYLVMALIAAIICISFRKLNIVLAAIIAALAYLLFCRLLRAMTARDHIKGIKAYQAGRFEEAISHFQASYNFFEAHPRLDAWRSPLLGVASYNPYRLIALGNMAYCYAQLGNGAKATELYEQVLRESPGHTLTIASLRMLRAGSLMTGTTSTQRADDKSIL